jgi:hypothetical protein
MATVKAVYEVPNTDGTDYNEVHFRTDADMVVETASKKFVTFATDLNKTPKEANAVINAQTLGSLLSNCKIIISDTKPTAEDGYNILWIDTTTLTA